MAERATKGAAMPFNLRGPELLVLVLIILLLFGAKRLPDVARGLGRSLRIFKAETKDLQGADAPEATDAPAAVEGGATLYRKSLRVLVDGREVASDPRDGWVYDERTHSIRFEGAAKRRAFLARIDVRYEEHR